MVLPSRCTQTPEPRNLCLSGASEAKHSGTYHEQRALGAATDYDRVHDTSALYYVHFTGSAKARLEIIHAYRAHGIIIVGNTPICKYVICYIKALLLLHQQHSNGGTQNDIAVGMLGSCMDGSRIRLGIREPTRSPCHCSRGRRTTRPLWEGFVPSTEQRRGAVPGESARNAARDHRRRQRAGSYRRAWRHAQCPPRPGRPSRGVV